MAVSQEAFGKTYDAFIANAQLCRQVLDEQPSQDQTVEDLRINAGFYLKQVRVTYDALQKAAKGMPPAQEVLLAPKLTEAQRHRQRLEQLLQSWELTTAR